MVSTIAELTTAIANQESPIVIEASIVFDRGFTINYPATIQGVDPSIALIRGAGFTGSLFTVSPIGNLALQTLILDGSNIAASPLLTVFGTLSADTVRLQNGISSVAGAIIIEANGTAQFNNAVITNCTGTLFNGPVLVQGLASLTISNSVLQNNSATASNGGAIFVNNPGTLQCTNVQFLQNTAFTNGGAIFANSTSSVTVTDCLFQENSATDGGALFLNPNSVTTVTTSTFLSNEATNNGGAIYPNAESQVTVTGSTITENRAGSNGGGIFLNNTGSLQLSDSLLQANSAATGGGGIYLNGATNTTITDTSYLGNSAETGGAVYVNITATLQQLNNTFLNNQATIDGGAIFNNFGGELSDQNGSYQGNVAGRGGAISNFGILNQIGNTQIGTVTVNQAAEAPGIYNGGTYTTNSILQNPNGFFIPDLANVVQLTRPLTPDSTIQLNQSSYVSPDPALSPIVVGIPTDSYPVLTQADADAFLKPVNGFEDWQVRLLNNQVVLVYDPAFTITYVNVRGAVNPNPTSYRPSDLPIVLQDPGPMPGFRFIGWFNVFGEQISVIPEGTTGDLVLFARYVPAPRPFVPNYRKIIACCRRQRACHSGNCK